MASALKTAEISKPIAVALSRLTEARGKSESELIRQGIDAVLRENDELDMQKLWGAALGG